MSDVSYYADAVDRILAYLEGGLGSRYKRKFEGDPVHIPQSLLPCICVMKLSGETKVSATGTNDLNEKILIKVVYSKKDDYGSNFVDDKIDFTERKLRRLVSGRDPATAAYLPASIFGILATNITLGNIVLSMDVSDEYGLDYRLESSGAAENYMTAEAYVTVDLLMRVVVQPRN